MRSTLAALACTAVMALPAGAQGPAFGVVGGFVSANVTLGSGNLAGQTARSGFAVGVAFGLPAMGAIQFAPEVLYVEKGTAGTSGGTTGNIRLGYLEVPALLRYSFPTSSTVRPFVTAGPTVADHLSCTLSLSSGGSSESADCDQKNGIKSTDFGLMFGGGISAKRLSISVRYELGLVNINKDATGDSVKNKALLVMVGIGL